MTSVYDSVFKAVGKTPLIRLSNIEKRLACPAKLLGKAEFFNPTGSIKDRAALGMLRAAESAGTLRKGGTVIEPTSGNTGIGLAALCAAAGYRCIIVMPDSMSVERIKLMRAYGAEVVLTPGALGMSGAVEKANKLKSGIEGAVIAGQFDNPANPEMHYATTAPEIWHDSGEDIFCLVAGIGSGGTVSGIGRYLKEKDPSVKIVGVEPASSPLLTAGHSGAHKIQGIGANFVPGNFDRSVTDEIIDVADEDAYAMARLLASCEGLLCGISSGAALHAAVQISRLPQAYGKNIVCILPDSGSRYLSSDLF